jgi:hypothetical protein
LTSSCGGGGGGGGGVSALFLSLYVQLQISF